MSDLFLDNRYRIKFLETPQEIAAVERLQAIVWPGDPREIVPLHLLLTAVHNGGVLIGAYPNEAPEREDLAGMVFGFVGLYETSAGAKIKHCSHMLGVHPDHRDQGIGFTLKRAQWQMVRRQGIELITWTYDPLLSRNAYLNIARLGAISSTYIVEAYGEMRDGLNVGLPSDRLQVDWWLNSKRVTRRLSKRARRKLDLAHFLAAGVAIVNPSRIAESGLASPGEIIRNKPFTAQEQAMLLVEIPADFQSLKATDAELALEWRLHSRALLKELFDTGYLITDFVYLPGRPGRSFYALSHGESTL